MTISDLLKAIEKGKSQQPHTGEWSSILFGEDLKRAEALLKELASKNT